MQVISPTSLKYTCRKKVTAEHLDNEEEALTEGSLSDGALTWQASTQVTHLRCTQEYLTSRTFCVVRAGLKKGSFPVSGVSFQAVFKASLHYLSC